MNFGFALRYNAEYGSRQGHSANNAGRFMTEKKCGITNAWDNRTLPDIFYETPKEAAERTGVERQARMEAEAQLEVEREARLSERLASEARERELLAEIERLRSLQSRR